MSEVNSIETLLEEYKVLDKLYNEAQNDFTKKGTIDHAKYRDCINRSAKMIKFLDDQNQFVTQRHKDIIKHVYFISAELLVRTIGLQMDRKGLTAQEKNTLYISIAHLRKVLNLEPFHSDAKELYKIVFLYLTLFNPNVEENLGYLRQVVMVDPCDYQVQYNYGFLYHRANKLEDSIIHYKMAIGLIDTLLLHPKASRKSLKEFKVKCLNGIGSVYYSIQDRDTALYYFDLAHKILPDDPDINNQMAVVYTELRFTDKAIYHYERGIKNISKAHISVDSDMLAASMNMNMGLAKCYECDFIGAIECYNKALKYKPRLSLAYQNKLLDSNYISHLIDDPMYIANLHKNINKIYPVVISDYRKGCPEYKPKTELLTFTSKADLIQRGVKVNIGFVSGDFICHPVSYFLNSILSHINYDLFNVHCYSVKVVSLHDTYPKCKWAVVKNMSPEDFKAKIQADKIDVLFDLSAHTGDNRLDTFVLKPAPIQISYCGYPNSAGIKSMDYRITDTFCDSEKSQKYYTERLVFMKHCFLAYTPGMGINNLPGLAAVQPCTRNGYITFGCFNRYNKINKLVISIWERVLAAIPDARFVIKTKEFLTPKLKKQFEDSFTDRSILQRITVLNYSDTYHEHLLDYNKMDVALDTFPYSGTTTSCEALLMGVPIITLFDNVRHYHSQNVTTSLMKNSGMQEFVTFSHDDYVNRAVYLAKNMASLQNLKHNVRQKFLNGHVCNYTEFVDEFENKILDLYKDHKW
ncbi:hypothetical protein EB118_01975 [bacterium]|nr:hypothetical protein [bacterium]NDC94185.1 hypothetical protein [bacterium]NDD83017.1 hypothetical protein [bacterium]NDG28855.1 hypothetical protein [bacterium]